MNAIRQTITAALHWFRQPEYTGENRCLPCTVLNTAIAAFVGSVVALASLAAGVVALASLATGVVVFAACLLVIVFRGYLVPGTPTLVQYLPERVHDAIGPGHEFRRDGNTIEEAVAPSFDVETTLKAADIIAECADADDLCLTDSYREAWQQQMNTLQSETAQRERLSRSLSVSPDEVTFEETDSGWHVSIDGIRAGGWQSKAAFVADLASEDLLASRLDAWETVAPDERTQLLVALRSFIETCPDCGGEVLPSEDVVRSCCRDDIVSVTTTCIECESVLFRGTES